MSILEGIKAKVHGLVEGHGDTVTEGIDTVHGLAEQAAAAGGKPVEQVEGVSSRPRWVSRMPRMLLDGS